MGVGPPLSAKGPNAGFRFGRSPSETRPQVSSSLRLCPREIKSPAQFAEEFWAIIVLAI